MTFHKNRGEVSKITELYKHYLDDGTGKRVTQFLDVLYGGPLDRKPDGRCDVNDQSRFGGGQRSSCQNSCRNLPPSRAFSVSGQTSGQKWSRSDEVG